MNNASKIEVAKDYVASHKKNNIEDWTIYSGVAEDDKKQAYLLVFEDLSNEVFGEVRDNEEYDENGEVTKKATEFEIEISSHDSKSGSPVIFTWSQYND